MTSPLLCGLLLTMGLFLAACAVAPAPLIDPDATAETKRLWQLLHRTRQSGVLFAHQNSDIEGIAGPMAEGRSDVLDSTGQWPAVIGYEFHRYRHSARTREIMADRMRAHHARGGIIEMSWHCWNPATGENFRDHHPDSIAAVLPGGAAHETMIAWLDELADFLLAITDDAGRPIPVLFRPWHEHTGGWFWWGRDSGTPEQYIELWKMTITHLRDRRGVHNLIWVISPSKPGDGNDYTTHRFPGMDWVDVLGFDTYLGNDEQFANLLQDLNWLEELADEHGKLPALTEVGYARGINNYQGEDWWAGKLLPLFKGPDAPRPAWLLTWRNGGPEHYWVPIGEMPGAEDFRRFADDETILMLDDLVRLRSDFEKDRSLPQ